MLYEYFLLNDGHWKNKYKAYQYMLLDFKLALRARTEHFFGKRYLKSVIIPIILVNYTMFYRLKQI